MSQTPTNPQSIETYMDSMPHGMGGLNVKMGVTILEASADRVVGTMPVEGNTQPMGLLHGGASAALAETLGSVGSHMHAMTMGKAAVGVDLNATHHRGATTGLVTGTATAIHLGRTTAAYEIVITNEAGKRVCTARITCALIPAPTE
ncbi:hotdog fold thioesterase [Nocardioides sp.]|uniref:hotdog fold thioesterase n=1 Tax=Nocardioides sp. TaxID=35761 RepID=UPI00260D8CE3|nr:hotdog fold thioesterase [Nocardioides sp.]